MKNRVYVYILAVLLLLPFSVGAYTFTRNLKQGDTGTDVLELQKILNSNSTTKVSSSGAGSIGQETTYFGNATRKAVIAFQELYRSEILTPAGLSKGTGFVGASTRQKLNSMNSITGGNKAATTSSVQMSQNVVSSAPVLTALSNSTVGNGDRLVLYGKNFQAKNTILVSIDLPEKYKDIVTASTTSTEIVFTSTVTDGLKQRLSGFDSNIRSAILDKIRQKMVEQSPSADGVWYFPATISIRNEFGTSNSLPININILKGI